jgi:hypothetical protein
MLNMPVFDKITIESHETQARMSSASLDGWPG